ncbi:mCG1033051, partial [Mus musculus]
LCCKTLASLNFPEETPSPPTPSEQRRAGNRCRSKRNFIVPASWGRPAHEGERECTACSVSTLLRQKEDRSVPAFGCLRSPDPLPERLELS